MPATLTALRRTLLILVSLAGLGLSAVLAVFHFHGQVALFSSLCRQESIGLDCVAVAQSRHSRLFGIPQALIGMGFFLLQLGYTVGATPRRGRLWHQLPAWLAVAGMFYCLRMAWIMAGLGTWCVFCAAVYLMGGARGRAALAVVGARFDAELRLALPSGTTVVAPRGRRPGGRQPLAHWRQRQCGGGLPAAHRARFGLWQR